MSEKKWISKAYWPEEVNVGCSTDENSTTDSHRTKEAAEYVCRMLKSGGLGGERKHFPTKTEVYPRS